jgi:hypothetical protein
MGNIHWKPQLIKLEELGIEFQVLKQMPGDAIFVGYNAYHWVYAEVSIL